MFREVDFFFTGPLGTYMATRCHSPKRSIVNNAFGLTIRLYRGLRSPQLLAWGLTCLPSLAVPSVIRPGPRGQTVGSWPPNSDPGFFDLLRRVSNLFSVLIL